MKDVYEPLIKPLSINDMQVAQDNQVRRDQQDLSGRKAHEDSQDFQVRQEDQVWRETEVNTLLCVLK